MIDAKISEKKEVKDLLLQSELLQGVSRTFALTIPQLPENLRIGIRDNSVIGVGPEMVT